MIPVSVHYVPVVLRSTKEICTTFGTSPERIRTWVKEGAPIAVETDKNGSAVRYRSELIRLYMWLEMRNRQSPEWPGD